MVLYCGSENYLCPLWLGMKQNISKPLTTHKKDEPGLLMVGEVRVTRRLRR